MSWVSWVEWVEWVVSSDALVLLAAFGAAVFGFWAFEAALVPIVTSAAWSVRDNYLLFLFTAAVYACATV